MIDESALAAKMFGTTTPSQPASRPEPAGDAAARMFPEQAAQPNPLPARANAPRITHDGRGGLRTQAGIPVPPRQGQAQDPAEMEAQIAARQYGPSSDIDGNALDPLESIGAQTPDHILRDRADRDPEGAGKLFAGETDTGETRLAIDKAIDTITPDVPTTLRQAVTAEYAAIAGDIGLEPSEVSEIAQAAQGAFANGAPDIDTRSAWRYTSGNIAAGYGSRQSAVVSEAQRMIASDPRVKTMLARTGLGDHPAVVKNVLAAADRRLRGSK